MEMIQLPRQGPRRGWHNTGTSLVAAHAKLIPHYKPRQVAGLPPVESDGVGVAALKWLKSETIAQFGEEAAAKMTTTDVCDQLVKPLLKQTPDWTLLDVFNQQKVRALRGKPATRFVSHCWQYNFFQVISTLIDLAEQQKGEAIFFWFDLCCNNQHRASSLPYEWWTTTFATCVGAIGHTVLLYGPWDDPLALKRSWCLYELHTSVKQDCEMDVQLLDGNSMKKALETGADEISVALSKINSRSANAWSADDQAKINQAVEDSIGFHELDVQVMRYVRDRIAKQARVLYEQNKGNVALISGYANLLTDQGKLAEAEQFYRKALDLRVKECGQEHVLTLLAMNDLATLLKRREQLNEAEQLYGIALAHLEALKPDHQYKYLLLTVIHNMATLFKQQKRLDEAEQLFLRALEGRETSLGPDHLSTLKTISNLASLFRDRSQLDDAEDLCRRALDGYELKLGADHPHTLNSIHSLAKVLGKRGKMKEAETQYRRALAGRERRLGSHHQATITTVHELATLLMKLGPEQRQEADELLTRAMLAKVILDGRRSVLTTLHNLAKLRATDRHERKAVEVKILQELVDRLEIKRGLQHLDTLTAVSHLANLHAQHGDLDKAEQHLRRVLRGREVELGEFHSSTISAVQWLADALSEQGKLEEAKELYQRALAGVDQSLEFIDPDATGSIANRLAQVLRRLGQLDAVVKLYKTVLNSRQAARGQHDPSAISTATSLAGLLQEQGKTLEAKSIFHLVYESQKIRQGEHHQDTQRALDSMANLTSLLGKLDAAEVLYKKLLGSREHSLGIEHVDTLKTVHCLVILLKTQCKIDEALALCQHVEAGCKDSPLGDAHLFTLSIVEKKAWLQTEQQNYDVAEQLYRQVYQEREAQLGPNGPDTLSALHNLAYVAAAQGKLDHAEKLYHLAVAGRKSRLGLDHPETFQSTECLAEVLQKQGKLNELEDMYREAIMVRERDLDPNHSSTLRAIETLANFLCEMNELDEAGALYATVVDRRRIQLGPYHRLKLAATYKVAEILSKQGRREKAETLHRQVLADRQDHLQLHHVDTLKSMVTLSKLLNSSGHLAEAKALYDQLFDILKEKLGGPLHVLFKVVARLLAGLLEKQGKLKELEALHRNILNCLEQSIGVSHTDTIDAVVALASVLKKQESFDAANQLYRRALAARPEDVNIVNNLALVLTANGQIDDAIQHYRHLLQITQRTHPPSYYFGAMNNLAILLHRQPQHIGEAEALYREALLGLENCVGPAHSSTLSVANNLANLLSTYWGSYFGQADSAIQEAVGLYQRVLESQRSHLDITTIDTIHNLAVLKTEQGEDLEVERLLRQALAARETKLGENHYETLCTAEDLAQLLVKKGNLDEAEMLFRRAMNGFLRLDHQDTASTALSLANMLRDQGIEREAETKLQEAEALYEYILNRCEKRWGTPVGKVHPFVKLVLKCQRKLFASRKLRSTSAKVRSSSCWWTRRQTVTFSRRSTVCPATDATD